MNKPNILYAHLLSVLFPRTLTIYDKDKLLIDYGILQGIINGDNQTILLNAIINYMNDFYSKFMWDTQRMVHEYNLLHTITISVDDCYPNKNLVQSYEPIIESILSDLYEIPLSNVDSLIINANN